MYLCSDFLLEVNTAVKSLFQKQAAVADESEDGGCQHHWVIEKPNGPFSDGVCRNCGEERRFMNSIEGGSSWGNDSPSSSSLTGGLKLKTEATGTRPPHPSKIAEDK